MMARRIDSTYLDQGKWSMSQRRQRSNLGVGRLFARVTSPLSRMGIWAGRAGKWISGAGMAIGAILMNPAIFGWSVSGFAASWAEVKAGRWGHRRAQRYLETHPPSSQQQEPREQAPHEEHRRPVDLPPGAERPEHGMPEGRQHPEDADYEEPHARSGPDDPTPSPHGGQRARTHRVADPTASAPDPTARPTAADLQRMLERSNVGPHKGNDDTLGI